MCCREHNLSSIYKRQHIFSHTEHQNCANVEHNFNMWTSAA